MFLEKENIRALRNMISGTLEDGIQDRERVNNHVSVPPRGSDLEI